MFFLPATALLSYSVMSPICLFISTSQLGVFSTLNRTGNLNKAEEYKEGIHKKERQTVVLFATVV